MKSTSAGSEGAAFSSGRSMSSRKARLRRLRRSFPERLSGWWLGEGIQRRSSPVLREIAGLVSPVVGLLMQCLPSPESAQAIPAVVGTAIDRRSRSGAMVLSPFLTLSAKARKPLIDDLPEASTGLRAAPITDPFGGALWPLTGQPFFPKFFVKELMPDSRNQSKRIYPGCSR